MLFDSLAFFVFFLFVYGAYLLLERRQQNLLLLLASYFFYGCWDWRFLALLWITTINDYLLGIRIDEAATEVRRKHWLWLSIAVNLGILAAFKYFNFFVESLVTLFSLLGLEANVQSLQLILPVGLSFYTFQSLSYTIDVYRRDIRARRNFLEFALFTAFFPQLVAGPIERAKKLLPQIETRRLVVWNDIVSGTHLIFLGLFQKVCVADNLAPIVKRVYSGGTPYNGSEVAIAGLAFSIQLLCDFAGYSNMARGLARLMGFELSVNFRTPYFSQNLREFWQRWHITMGRWFKDYLYLPLRKSFAAESKLAPAICVLITFTMVGLWHGASWNYVLWGMLVGLQFVAYLAIEPSLKKYVTPRSAPARFAWYLASVFLVNVLWILGSCLFLAPSLKQSGDMYLALLSSHDASPRVWADLAKLALYASLFLALECLQFLKDDARAVLQLPLPVRSFVYLLMFYSLAYLGKLDGSEFFYFQF